MVVVKWLWLLSSGCGCCQIAMVVVKWLWLLSSGCGCCQVVVVVIDVKSHDPSKVVVAYA